MKKLQWPVQIVSVVLLGFLASGCSTVSNQANNSPRFQDAEQANVVLQFSTWESIFMTHPDTREQGFLPILKKSDISPVLDRLSVPRGTAVVVIGWTYDAEKLDHIVSDWKTLLSGCGFRRVVLVRANAARKLNGSLIIDDSNRSIAMSREPARL